MDDEGEEPNEEEPLPELCDLCGAVISDRTEAYALVPDSSAVHARDPKLNGRRLITACSAEHLAALQEQYRQRPFVSEELWAGQIARALEHNPEGLSRERLSEETGLNPRQIERALAWKNQQYLRWREEFGGPGNAPPSRPDGGS